MAEENQNQNSEIRQLIEENLRLTKEVHLMTKKVKNYVTFQKIMSVLYFLLFVLPLVLAVLYLPKFINEYLRPFQELMNSSQPANSFNTTEDLLNQAQKIINNGGANNNGIK